MGIVVQLPTQQNMPSSLNAASHLSENGSSPMASQAASRCAASATVAHMHVLSGVVRHGGQLSQAMLKDARHTIGEASALAHTDSRTPARALPASVMCSLPHISSSWVCKGSMSRVRREGSGGAESLAGPASLSLCSQATAIHMLSLPLQPQLLALTLCSSAHLGSDAGGSPALLSHGALPCMLPAVPIPARKTSD